MRASAYHMESKCQRYTIAKVMLDEALARYLAWFRVRGGPLCLGDEASSDDARRLCEQHEIRAVA